MPSAKARGAKPKSSLKRVDARGKRKGKEVRELWFNPHVKKRGETLEEIYGCDCDCDVMLDENVQRELRRLTKVYSQTTVDDEYDDDEEGKSKGFLCFKKSSQRTRSKQNEDKEERKRRKSKEKEDREKTKRRKSKEKEDTEKSKRRKSKEKEDREKSKRRKSKETADTEMRKRRNSNERESPSREHERMSHSRRPTSVNCRFKTQEEVRHYRELKRIYTTKPRPRQARTKPTGTTCFKKKKDKRREEDAEENSLESSSVDSVYSGTHMARKPVAESAAKSRARTSKLDASARQREDDKKPKETKTKKDKKSNVGCCGKRKKSKVDKEEEEFEAYKLAQSAPKTSKKPTAATPPECALTPEEIELLEKLKQTYAMEQPKVVRKATTTPPPPPPPEEPGCCGTKSKKKKRRSEDESYTPRRTKSAEINVKRKHLPKTGKSKSDSSFYISDRKETCDKTLKHKNCFCFACIRRRCQSSKPTKKHAKKPKEKTKITTVKRPKAPVVIKPHHEPEKPKKSDSKPTKTKSREKLRQKDSNISCCSLQKNKTKKEDTTKIQIQKPTKTQSQQKVRKQSPNVKKVGEQIGKKLSFLSCCSLSKKEKQKKEAIPKVKSLERVRKQTSVPTCCSFTKREKSEKSKKPDDALRKSPKPKDHEMLPKKASNVSCCSFAKSDKTKKQAVIQQKPTKVRDPEKPQKKVSNVSCCTFAKKEKSQKTDEIAQKPAKAKEKVQKVPKTVTCCPLTTKDMPKKSDGIARRNIFNILCCLSDKKDKTKNEHDTKENVKSQEKISTKPSNVTCCSFSKKVKPKKLPESSEKPTRTKQKIKVKEKLTAISCCPVFKKDKQKKSGDSPQKEPKKKLSEITCCSIYKKHKQSKTEDSQQKSPRAKVKVKMKNKISETSCCSGLFQKDKSKKSDGTQEKAPKKKSSATACCSGLFQKDKSKKSDGTQEKAPKKKSSATACCSGLFQKDKQKKSDGFPRKPPSTKDQTEVKKKLSEASCCSIFHKDKSKRVDVPKRKPTKVKSTEKSTCLPVFSCCSVDKNKPKTMDRTKKKPVKRKSRESTQNPFEIFCALCKKRRSGKPKSMRPHTQIKVTGLPRLEQIKPQSSKPKTQTKSKMSFQTCWDWCDDDTDDNMPNREETNPRTSAEMLKQTAPKSKSSCTSFWTCCSSMCVPSKTKRQRTSKPTDKVEHRKQTVDEGAVKTKPENISYCKALYQEFENLAMQQTLYPIMLPETNLRKKSKGIVKTNGLSNCQQNLSKLSIKETRSDLSTKSKKQQTYQKETKEIRKSKAKEDKEIQRKLKKEPSATYIKLPKRKVKSEMQNVHTNSDSDSGIEKVYVPQYVLGKPVQLGVSLAHARKMTYNLILNRDTRKRSDKYFHKGFTYGIGCQN